MTDWEKFTFETNPNIRVGISSCLLGEEVRYNGGHAHDSFVTTMLGQYFEWVDICPEMDIGMGTPRENIRLVNTDGTLRVIAPKSGTDYTEKMQTYAVAKTEELSQVPLHGYILKKNSPTCGMERVRIYDKNSVPRKNGVGVFAAQLMEQFPLLPMEEEGRLRDNNLRESFIERVFAYYRLKRFLGENPEPGDLVEFHTRHKLTFLSHNQEAYREMGRMVANAGESDLDSLLDEYTTKYMEALKIHANAKKHTNVLHHILGYFKNDLDANEKEEMVSIIDQYREGILPLIVPVTLLKHHLMRHPDPWLEKQVYLHPYPQELKLRNVV